MPRFPFISRTNNGSLLDSVKKTREEILIDSDVYHARENAQVGLAINEGCLEQLTEIVIVVVENFTTTTTTLWKSSKFAHEAKNWKSLENSQLHFSFIDVVPYKIILKTIFARTGCTNDITLPRAVVTLAFLLLRAGPDLSLVTRRVSILAEAFDGFLTDSVVKEAHEQPGRVLLYYHVRVLHGEQWRQRIPCPLRWTAMEFTSVRVASQSWPDDTHDPVRPSFVFLRMLCRSVLSLDSWAGQLCAP